MIKVIQDFYKLSEKKNYKSGDNAEFDNKTEERLIKEGLAGKVIEKKVVKKSKK
tara:strand:+ start:12821 stop:12982 length:162 start_codon:yes stop_codon:yes gene_type:complete